MADYQAAARQFAIQHGLNPNVFVRQIRQESGFNPNARSPAGAVGIAQFMPGTAKGLGVNPSNPMQALEGAAKLMAQYVHQYGNYRDALVAYNAGPGAVGGKLPLETQAYVRNILGGANPSAGRPGSVTTTTSTTSITPQAQQARRNALAQFVLAGNNADPLKLATDYARLGKQTQTTTSVKTTGGTSSSAPTSAKGVAKFDGKPVAAWIAPALQWARQHGWKGTVSSGYRSYADQQRIYNSGVRPAAKPGTSNHEFTAFPGGAVDVTDPQGLAALLQRSPFAGKLVWAGSKDAVHFSHPHNGGY